MLQLMVLYLYNIWRLAALAGYEVHTGSHCGVDCSETHRVSKRITYCKQYIDKLSK